MSARRAITLGAGIAALAGSGLAIVSPAAPDAGTGSPDSDRPDPFWAAPGPVSGPEAAQIREWRCKVVDLVPVPVVEVVPCTGDEDSVEAVPVDVAPQCSIHDRSLLVSPDDSQRPRAPTHRGPTGR